MEQKLIDAIDLAWADEQGASFRYHLGASIIGRECPREIFYSFRWWFNVQHTGRMLRLFERGQREEYAVIESLQKIGATLHLAGDNQQHVQLIADIYGGSCDGIITGLDSYGYTGFGVLEIKTHGSKSFATLNRLGVKEAKQEHYAQFNQYAGHYGAEWSLYWSVNKDNDELFLDVIPFNGELYQYHRDRAYKILRAIEPPKRISSDPTWWKCRFCDYKSHCHGSTPPDKNCRTCEYVELRIDEDAGTHEWFCRHWRRAVPKDFSYAGCDKWSPILD